MSTRNVETNTSGKTKRQGTKNSYEGNVELEVLTENRIFPNDTGGGHVRTQQQNGIARRKRGWQRFVGTEVQSYSWYTIDHNSKGQRKGELN